MSYKTILVHVDDSPHAAARIRIAADIAVAHNAHLIGAAFSGVSKFVYESSALGASDTQSIGIQLDILHQRAEKALAQFDALVKETELDSYEGRLVDDEAGTSIVLQARYSDLVIIGQTDEDASSASVTDDFPEYVVVHGGRPVLIVPVAGRFETVGKKVLVAWDASAEATHALTGALPLLANAEIVKVAAFNPSQNDAHGEQAGADIALYLARHGIKAEVAQQTTDVDIGSALLSRAADFNVDLIVMGAYGHSRLREVLLGGATRTVLASMTVPVLMSH